MSERHDLAMAAEKDRVIADAELLKGGARYVRDANGNRLLQETKEQRVAAVRELEEFYQSLDRQGRWEEMVNKAKEERKTAVIKEQLKRYREKASEMNITEVGGDWIPVDGVPYKVAGTEEIYTIPVAADGVNVTSERVDLVGHFCSNNGVLAYVDGEGEMYVAPSTPDREEALTKAGYQYKDFNVPFSNSEVFAGVEESK